MSKKTYFRVQSPDRDPQELLEPEFQISRAWGHDHIEDEDRKTDRNGVSVCESREELAEYLATTGMGIPFGSGGWVIVEVAGYLSDDRPLDEGECLIHPTEIVSVSPIEEIFEMISAAYDAHNGA